MNERFSCIHFIREIRSELGGVVTAVTDLSQSMAAHGHRIIIVTCDAPGCSRRLEQFGR